MFLLLLCAILCHNDEAIFAGSQLSLKESVQQESGISRIVSEAQILKYKVMV